MMLEVQLRSTSMKAFQILQGGVIEPVEACSSYLGRSMQGLTMKLDTVCREDCTERPRLTSW